MLVAELNLNRWCWENTLHLGIDMRNLQFKCERIQFVLDVRTVVWNIVDGQNKYENTTLWRTRVVLYSPKNAAGRLLQPDDAVISGRTHTLTHTHTYTFIGEYI